MFVTSPLPKRTVLRFSIPHRDEGCCSWDRSYLFDLSFAVIGLAGQTCLSCCVSVQIILQAEPKHLIKKLGKQMVVLNLHGPTRSYYIFLWAWSWLDLCFNVYVKVKVNKLVLNRNELMHCKWRLQATMREPLRNVTWKDNSLFWYELCGTQFTCISHFIFLIHNQ